MEKYKILNCDNEMLDKQKQELTNEIVNGHNDNKFKVFDIECGTGKTETAQIAFAKLVIETDKKAIFVRPDNADGIKSANIINELVGRTVAFSYNGDTVSEDERDSIDAELDKYDIILITHQKYLVLATDKKKHKLFTKGRSVLVIDEFINEIRHISLNQVDIDTYKLIFRDNWEILNAYIGIVRKIEDFIQRKSWPDSLKNNDAGRYPIKINESGALKKIDLLIKYIKSNFTTKTLKTTIETVLSGSETVNRDLLENCKTVRSLCYNLEDMKEYYRNICILENGCVHTWDSKMKKWLLDNNIQLDASGELQIAYTIDTKLYKLNHNEKVLDHSNWTLINIPVNTTTNGKAKIINFYDEVNSIVKKYGQHHTLVVGSKKEIEKININDENKGYFGHITGKNEWRDLRNIIVMQTPNISDIEYILRYFYYSKDFMPNSIISKTSGRNLKLRYSFSDPRFERVRCFWIAEQIYQSIKRVNRDMSQSTNAVVIINNDDVMELLKIYLKGCKYEILDNQQFKYKYSKQDAYVDKLKKDSYVQKFKDLLVELQFGKYPELLHPNNKGEGYKYSKKGVRELLGINDSAKFLNKVLYKDEIIEYCRIRNIDISGHYIIIPEQLISK